MHPLYPQALLGFRFWVVTEAGLHSLATLSLWNPGVNKAACHSSQEHVSPQSSCRCGLYAYHSLHGVRSHVKSLSVHWEEEQRDVFLIGAIAGRGRAEIHWNGWRAQEAVILGLLLSPSQQARGLDKILAPYNAPIFDDPSQLFQEGMRHADTAPRSLRPAPPLKGEQLEHFKRRYTEVAHDLVESAVLAEEMGLRLSDIHDLAAYYGLIA